MNKYFTEFIGTMFLVLVVGIAAIGGQAGAMAPVAIGTILMVMVYAGGHISGAHYNPAVTFAVLIRKKISINDAIVYWIAQIGGAMAAWAIAKFIFDVEGPGTSAIKSVEQGLGAEILGCKSARVASSLWETRPPPRRWIFLQKMPRRCWVAPIPRPGRCPTKIPPLTSPVRPCPNPAS